MPCSKFTQEQNFTIHIYMKTLSQIMISTIKLQNHSIWKEKSETIYCFNLDFFFPYSERLTIRPILD